jgi:hypothetical protein
MSYSKNFSKILEKSCQTCSKCNFIVHKVVQCYAICNIISWADVRDRLTVNQQAIAAAAWASGVIRRFAIKVVHIYY